jgi:hypothetical protein
MESAISRLGRINELLAPLQSLLVDTRDEVTPDRDVLALEVKALLAKVADRITPPPPRFAGLGSA